jgi:4,5-DOPA dioxygenase extradiol
MSASPRAARAPAIFVSHGAPTLPLDDIPARDFLRQFGEELAGSPAKPRAIVAVSAHTIGRGTVVGSTSGALHAVHDFRGFPEALHALRYDPPGDEALAVRVAERLREAGIDRVTDAPIEGLDHGIWVPMLLMFPQADIPVVVVSLDAGFDAARHMAIGTALAALRDEGVMVLATGSVTHNLQEALRQGIDAPIEAYAEEFSDWVSDTVESGDRAALRSWRSRAPQALRAHPTPEHFMPLLVAAGACRPGGRGHRLHESFTYGALGMHAYRFD